YDPVWTDFDGKGTQLAPVYTQSQKKQFHDPFAGTTPEGRFTFAAGGTSLDDVPVERLNLRRALLARYEAARRRLDAPLQAGAFERQRAQAFHLLTSRAMRDALD